MNKRTFRGFTLIELLIVIAIIGILVSVMVVVVNPLEQFKKARDAQRKADIHEIQGILELFYEDYGQYPLSEESHLYLDNMPPFPDGRKDWGDEFLPYAAELPEDPEYPGYPGRPLYKYFAYPTGCGYGTDLCRGYMIYAHLERKEHDPDICPGTSCPGPSDVSHGCGKTSADTCNYMKLSPNLRVVGSSITD